MKRSAPGGRSASVFRRVGAGCRRLTIEPLESRRFLDVSAWTNVQNPLDVNADGLVVPQDALILINRMQQGMAGQLPDPGPTGPPPYLDVDGDGLLAPIDAMLVINWLNADLTGPTIDAALENDTGTLGADWVSHAIAVVGTAIDPAGTTSLKASFGNALPRYDLKSDLLPDGSFRLSEARLAQILGGPLGDGRYTLNLLATDARGHSTFARFEIVRDTTAPVVELAVAAYLNDLTPLVTVAAFDGYGMPAHGVAIIDVDLNNDGDFADPGESNFASGELAAGQGVFALSQPLPLVGPGGGAYDVRLRARVADLAGNFGASAPVATHVDTLMSTALADYVALDDGAYQYTLHSTAPGAGFTRYLLDLKSQTWRSAADVNRTLWEHWVTVIVPHGPLADTATLVIGSGSQSGPSMNNSSELAYLATSTKSVVVYLPTVPNQPLRFTGETSNRYEDEIIAYTFDKFLDDTSDETWPVLLPMVKSAVKTMDAVQDFLPTVRAGEQVDGFLVTGASKRGWTTWLTAAIDDRVRAIAPAVFDALNLDEQMVHHYGSLGFFSEAIADYQQAQVFDRILTPAGQELGRIVDPYQYLHAGRYDIPKLIMNSAGDEFFLPDSSQFYFDDLPGENYLRYFPNTGHDLDATAGESLLAFVDAVLNDRDLPRFSWRLQADGAIRVETVDAPLEVRMWQATNDAARDFRNYFTGIPWTSSALVDQGGGVYEARVAVPETGATAFFIELRYASAVTRPNGTPILHRFTTQIHVSTGLPRHDWPFPGTGAAAAQSPVAANQQAAASAAARDLVFGQFGATRGATVAANRDDARAIVLAAAVGAKANASRAAAAAWISDREGRAPPNADDLSIEVDIVSQAKNGDRSAVESYGLGALRELALNVL